MRVKNILQYLEATAARVPDRIAFSGEEAGENMSFAALLACAKRVGSALCRQDLQGARVAILTRRSPKAIAAMLGAIYAGAVYVPLDPSIPRLRKELLLRRSRARFVLCDASTMEEATALGVPHASVDELFEQEIDEQVLAAVRAAQIDTDPIYIIYTSGSTGEPKGVLGCHRAVIDYGEALTAALEIDGETVYGCQSPLYFDAPLKEILGTLICGARTVFLPRKLFSFPLLLMRALIDCGVNTICWVSSALSTVCTLGALQSCPPHTLRRVVFGSEILPRPHYDAWRAALPETIFYQLYGPTEATGMSCLWRADRTLADEERIPIGAPLDNTGLFLLDEGGQPIYPRAGTTSESGEIYLRGTCLTLGYDDNTDANRAAFVPNPLHDDYPETVYRTGDLARYNTQGELVFIGRHDGQIKRMGHRIEIGEIEAAAQCVRGVERAICLPIRDEPILFYVGRVTTRSLCAQLLHTLPRDYMPTHVVYVDVFPLTDNGKIDRRALVARYEKEKNDGNDHS